MNTPRDTIADALATLIGGTPSAPNVYPILNPAMVAAGFKTFGRRLKLWTGVDISDKPAAFLVSYDEDHDRKAIAGPDKPTLMFALVVYDDVSDPAAIPSQRMNNLLDGIDNVFKKATDGLTGRVTLGGLVQHCWVEGTAKVSPGDLDSQSVAVYPIRVLCP